MRILLALAGLILSLSACAESDNNSTVASAAPSKNYTEGTHYVLIDKPVRTQNANKIEVTEVFWYGCGHCFTFEPIVQGWKKKLPADVEFVQSPAMWNSLMQLHARMFYSAKALGVLDKAHGSIFNAMHVQKNRLSDQQQISSFFKQFGVEPGKFDEVFKSWSVGNQVQQADARARSYKIGGTPEMVVDGRYRTTGKLAGGQKQMLDIVDFLIAKVRQERGLAQ